MKLRGPKCKKQQSQCHRQWVHRLTRHKVPIVPGERALYFRGKIGRMQIVGNGDGWQQNRRQHGQRNQLYPDGRQQGGFIAALRLVAAPQAG